MGIPGLTAFLLMLGFLAPAVPAPLRPLCDQRVMDKYIQDASKVESEIAELCKASCDLPGHVTVLDTRVNFPAWSAMNRSSQASEVWRGQALLSAAVSRVKGQQPATQPFRHQLEVIESYLRSIREILRGHGAQVAAAAQEEISARTLSVQTVNKLFSIYSSFLRGKVNLFIAGACKDSGR
ncbi:Erythropoietin [Varanus komodoensis]|uniref:Erythropoietin n=1 Tax=Varanus komodoensis TaxID=61221 RepID=A0A8D2Q5E3_VARKO|nr:erythropoietin [Varanus komodoensis]KAF7236770.1 Erythropoietin [Varanus komodoensis]